MDNLVTTRLASLTEHHVLNQVNQTRKANKLPVLDNLDVIDKSVSVSSSKTSFIFQY